MQSDAIKGGTFSFTVASPVSSPQPIATRIVMGSSVHDQPVASNISAAHISERARTEPSEKSMPPCM